jgi:hypothetical protein
MIWDADFMLSRRGAGSIDTYVLGEINVSCVPHARRGAGRDCPSDCRAAAVRSLSGSRRAMAYA